MADSGAVRQARYKHHRAGDHSLCSHWPQPAAVSVLPVPAPDASFDPEAELRALAGLLAAAYLADPSNAILARELRVTLQVLAADVPHRNPDLADLMRDLGSS